ncbi:MAG: hypothetical protein LBB91_11920 [Clostridiales bacterium]|jgi:electron transfer flavoprotein beta subunit|nr:hypothetical protein [Clostridiales bacterium]
MRIVVCIKPVKSELVYPNEERQESLVMNPYDLYALESCLTLKQETECEIICLCMGPRQSEGMLTKAFAMGADKAILLNDSHFGGSDTVATTYILSQAIQKIGQVDIVAFGEKSIDGETGQVVHGLSEMLGYPCLCHIESLEKEDDTGLILSQNDGQYQLKLRAKLPLAISFCEFRLSQPDISLLALKRARQKEVTIWNAADIGVDLAYCGLSGSKTQVLNVKNELIKKSNTILEGLAKDKTNSLLRIIKGEQLSNKGEIAC